MADHLGRDDAGEGLRRHARELVRRHRPTIEQVAAVLIERRRLSAKAIDALVWPEDSMTGFICFKQLSPFVHATRETVMVAMRFGEFPRSYLFNRRVMWRVRDIEAWRVARQAVREGRHRDDLGELAAVPGGRRASGRRAPS